MTSPYRGYVILSALPTKVKKIWIIQMRGKLYKGVGLVDIEAEGLSTRLLL